MERTLKGLLSGSLNDALGSTLCHGFFVSGSRQPPSGPGDVQVHMVDIHIQNSTLPGSPGSPCYLATLQETGNKHTGGRGIPIDI